MELIPSYVVVSPDALTQKHCKMLDDRAYIITVIMCPQHQGSAGSKLDTVIQRRHDI